MNFQQIENIITKEDWVLIRKLGSNYQYQKNGCKETVIIPNCQDKDIPTDVIKNLENKIGLSLLR